MCCTARLGGVSLFFLPITYDSTILSPPTPISRFPLMSHTHPTSPSSNFRPIFDDALKVYKKRTKNDLLTHPLADRFAGRDSASSILTVLQEQVQGLNESQLSNTNWLDPIVNVLCVFSETLGEGVGSVCFKIRNCPRSTLSNLFDRYPHLQSLSLSVLLSFFQCVPFLIPSCDPS